jgi:hypothetical protein
METQNRRNGTYLKPCNKKELAAMYGISVHVLNTWLKPIMPKLDLISGRCYTVKQVNIIFEALGVPDQSMEAATFESVVKIHPASIQKYAELSWDFTYRNILYRYLLGEDEITNVKRLIVKYYKSISPENFSFCVQNFYNEFTIRVNKASKNENCEKEEALSVIMSALLVTNPSEYKSTKQELSTVLNLSVGTIA